MVDTLRIKRRAAGGAAGAPTALAAAELAYNEQDDTLYYGKGNSSGAATSILPIAGPGSFAPIASPTFTGNPKAPTPTAGSNDTSIPTTAWVKANASGATVIVSDTAPASPNSGQLWFESDSGNLYIWYVDPNTSQWIAVSGIVVGGAGGGAGGAPLDSPTFTGDPKAPTPSTSDNDTSIATTAFVQAAIAAAAGASAFSTGDVKLTLKTTPDSGWVLFDDGSIGSAASGATYANAASQNLFNLLFANTNDTNCPIQTSSGAATTRAAQGTAAAAWTANCRMLLPKVLGRALAAAGSGSGLTARGLGATVGLETNTTSISTTPTITIATGNMPVHAHAAQQGINFMCFPGSGGGLAAGADWYFNGYGSTELAGGGAAIGVPVSATTPAFSVMSPSAFLNVMVKL